MLWGLSFLTYQVSLFLALSMCFIGAVCCIGTAILAILINLEVTRAHATYVPRAVLRDKFLAPPHLSSSQTGAPRAQLRRSLQDGNSKRARVISPTSYPTREVRRAMYSFAWLLRLSCAPRRIGVFSYLRLCQKTSTYACVRELLKYVATAYLRTYIYPVPIPVRVPCIPW